MLRGAIGFRSKTGRAIAVMLSGDPAAPTLLWRGEISLADPAHPETAEPYHAVMELPWPAATDAIALVIQLIEAAAVASLDQLIVSARSHGVAIQAVGVVGSIARDLRKLGNHHIRAHAAEGILFRRVLEVAATHHSLPFLGFGEHDVHADEATLAELGRTAGPPWRTDERLAASAALQALAR
jgi:hypothetical protein